MNIVFMGTPEFAVPSLDMLMAEGYHVVGVVTQPDKPQGRKKVLTPTPVKAAAESHGLPVFQPVKLRDPEAVARLAEWKPDLIVTAAFGQILPKAVLDMPVRGCVNVHGSLLPKYRGGAPIQRSIINGESVTGVTLMYMAEGLDTGDMISRVEVPITDEDTSGTMFAKLSEAGSKLLQAEMPRLIAGETTAVPQNDEEASYARNLTREDEKMDWNRTSRELFNQIRGLVPFSGAFTMWDEQVFKVWAACNPDQVANEASSVSSAGQAEPGTVLQLNKSGIEIKTGNGSLWLTEVQPAGKKVMQAADFARGGTLKPGMVLR
ncbi:methionyl-tRNA formyltransferase [Paenibacillus polysaccharolyticus]|uniref:Methionyl-tRNA formyltransferase n=1 Tax=Paenibacillus polysaccharolyticus TaxID=582692 RepID=A0A1G5KMC0_9BACL|nr:methionyl-tRNA formyltransferase [Paenibacillus polysaccharolyticus]SCZ01776.1 methionyl-tRNA formyltransferase [Paenibacillus polysaccharolyticus]